MPDSADFDLPTSKGLGGLKIRTADIDGASNDIERIADELSSKSSYDADFLTVASAETGLRKSNTNDSLKSIIRACPNLSHVEDLTAFPSPLMASIATFTPFKPRNRPSFEDASPLPSRREQVPKRPLLGLQTNSLDDVKQPPHRVLPPKLMERLQRDDRGSRYVSVDVSQPVASIQMPSIVRHRSQSKVPKFGEHDNLHREPHFAAKHEDHQDDRTGRRRSVHSTTGPVDEDTYTIPCNGVDKVYHGKTVLGEGTFSRVCLAHRDRDYHDVVAIKSVELAPVGAADLARVEMAVRREIELLGKLNHPLLIKLHGFTLDKGWAHLALEFNPGRDLFVLAAENKAALTPRLVKRIFAEILTVVRYLHSCNIVHRDLKLENILLRRQIDRINTSAPYDAFFTTLTDLGLAREFDPSEPDLTTRCGSEDYAAPEIILGQPYDGRQSDAWALGALLYCLMEGRLPFDVIPGLEHKMKSKVLHRICRIEWRWVLLKDPDIYDSEWNGAKRIVTNLLRSRTKRWTLDQVAQDAWLVDDVAAVASLVAEERKRARREGGCE